MRIKGSHPAFTLIELLVVVAIIAVLIAILVPSLGRARQQAYQVKCAANLKEIGAGIFFYASDYNDRLPPLGRGNDFWSAQVLRYAGVRRTTVGSRTGLFTCPSQRRPLYAHLNGPAAGRAATVLEKLRADRGLSSSPAATRGPGISSRPLIEAVSYASAWGTPFDRPYDTPKLHESSRPYCQALISELHHFSGDPLRFYWLDTDRFEPRRHYGGANPTSNGTNWLFADSHVGWHSESSFHMLFCCQDLAALGFARYIHAQSQRCSRDSGATTSRR